MDLYYNGKLINYYYQVENIWAKLGYNISPIRYELNLLLREAEWWNLKYEGEFYPINEFSSTLKYFPLIKTWGCLGLEAFFMGFSNLITIPELDTRNVTNMIRCFSGCSNLTTIPELDTSNVTKMENCFSGCSNLKRIEGISFKSMGSISSYSGFIFGTSSSVPCRYILIKDIGTNSACTTLDFTDAEVWGIADTEVTDARQSLIDSLLTYSFNRRAAGYSDCTINLYSAVKALLTEDEITQIQAKGYLLTNY